jgi:hypothetical protein
LRLSTTYRHIRARLRALHELLHLLQSVDCRHGMRPLRSYRIGSRRLGWPSLTWRNVGWRTLGWRRLSPSCCDCCADPHQILCETLRLGHDSLVNAPVRHGTHEAGPIHRDARWDAAGSDQIREDPDGVVVGIVCEVRLAEPFDEAWGSLAARDLGKDRARLCSRARSLR